MLIARNWLTMTSRYLVASVAQAVLLILCAEDGRMIGLNATEITYLKFEIVAMSFLSMDDGGWTMPHALASDRATSR